uniref:BED-type domain-containing protein n=1 Tax=Steinernema glaseri TaxID=37863 RepID=A0A1I7XXH3_9BILA
MGLFEDSNAIAHMGAGLYRQEGTTDFFSPGHETLFNRTKRLTPLYCTQCQKEGTPSPGPTKPPKGPRLREHIERVSSKLPPQARDHEEVRSAGRRSSDRPDTGLSISTSVPNGYTIRHEDHKGSFH